jgi:beta-galactosidase/beta-glucuronidase
MAVNATIPRPEFPRPDFERSEWINLNGIWEFAFDDEDRGLKQRWKSGQIQLDRTILVPYCYQSKMSTLGIEEVHEIVWYRRTFQIPPAMKNKRILLKFGAVDYECTVWVNGEVVGSHRGGHVPFQFDITDTLGDENTVVLRVVDRDDPAQPRGKQTWRGQRFGCWYTPTTGIWQTVWLEAVGETAIDRVKMTPNVDEKTVTVEYTLDHFQKGLELRALVTQGHRLTISRSTSIQQARGRFTVDIDWPDELDDSILWRPESPNLFNIELSVVKQGVVLDRIKSYFGMRNIFVRDGMIVLNNVPYTEKLILDQGYWPESLLTPPSDEAIKTDILAAKAFGFNGARKHQKAEDPRFAYWADVLGFLVWSEMPSNYQFSDQGMNAMVDEWRAIIQRDYNHPSIVTWVPLNESWGVWNILRDKKMQEFSRTLYCLTRSLDDTRLVSSNDGWEQVESDICAIHDYEASGEVFKQKIQDMDRYLKTKSDWRLIYANGAHYQGQPLILTEYGGISFAGAKEGEWGYRSPVSNEEEFLARFASMTRAALDSGKFAGICYTQLTDVQQEINGLLTADRKPKIDPIKIKAILDR